MTWWNYLVLVNVYLLLFYGFYALLLRKETFFNLNRLYLIAASLLSFFIPLIQSDWVKNLFITQKVQYTIYSSPVMSYQFQPIENSQVTVGEVLLVIYLGGMIFLTARFIWQLISLKKIFNDPGPDAAYSFFKKVRLGDDLAGSEAIAAHEKAHAGQWHSADILMIETVMIINWFNPVVYLYRAAIKHIHEFIADRQALKSGTDKKDYALLLLSQTFNAPAHQLVNPFFNQSLLKQRIMMIQKNNSRKVKLVKYGLSAPLFILMLILSSATVNNSRTVQLLNNKVEKVFLLPAVADTDTVKHLKTTNIVYLPQPGKKTGGNFSETSGDKPVFTAVEQVPEFPGGIKAFGIFLSKNTKYPKEARDKNIQGKVILSFIVEPDGELSNIRVVRGVDPILDAEALRVMNLSPKWKPGIQNKHLVRVAYSVPISFKLANDDKGTPGSKTGAVRGNGSSSAIALAEVNPTSNTPDTATKGPQAALNSVKLNALYIVDGVENYNFDKIDPQEIESISVLKDRSAVALYGSKGANGVVLITTKKYL